MLDVTLVESESNSQNLEQGQIKHVRTQECGMQTIGLLTKVSLVVLFSITMTFQYPCVMCFKYVATTRRLMHVRRGRTLTSSITTSLSSTLSSQQKQCPFNLPSKVVAFSTSTTGSTSGAATTATTFQPPEPPGTKGIPIFPDIKILKPDENSNDHYDNAIRRNTDSNAIMVVTGANRGIGLQFVKSLLSHTKVRTDVHLIYCQVEVLQVRCFTLILLFLPHIYI